MDVMAYPPDVNSGGTLRNVPPLLSHRSLFAISFDGYFSHTYPALEMRVIIERLPMRQGSQIPKWNLAALF